MPIPCGLPDYVEQWFRNPVYKAIHTVVLHIVLVLPLRQSSAEGEPHGTICQRSGWRARHPRRGTTIDKLLDDFSFYLQQERVLAPTTVANYVSLIKKFLTHRFGTGPADLSDLTAAQVVGSVQRLVPSLCRKRAKVMTSALRSFLRYARYQDFIRSDLAACVPCV